MKPMYIGRQFLSNIIHISKWCEMEGEDGEYRSIGGISLSNMPFDYVMQLVGDATMIYDLQAKNAQLRTALEEALNKGNEMTNKHIEAKGMVESIVEKWGVADRVSPWMRELAVRKIMELIEPALKVCEDLVFFQAEYEKNTRGDLMPCNKYYSEKLMIIVEREEPAKPLNLKVRPHRLKRS